MSMDPTRYELGQDLGQGQTGRVSAARNEAGRQVAVKVFHYQLARPGPAVDELLRVQRLVQAMRHPGIQPVLEAGFDPDESLRVVSELAPQGSLADRLERQGPMPIREAVEAATRLGAALSHAHLAGVVHGDVKPSNALLGPDGAPRLSDFGHAGLVLQDELSRGLADEDYLAPELLGGERPGVRADVYGLAATLFALLTGEDPKSGPAWRVAPQLRPALNRALSADPAARHESVDAFLGEVNRAARPRKSVAAVALFLGMGLLVGLGVAVYLLLETGRIDETVGGPVVLYSEPDAGPPPSQPPEAGSGLGVTHGRGLPPAGAASPEAAAAEPALAEAPACETTLEDVQIVRTITGSGWVYGYVENHCVYAIEKPRVELVFFDATGRQLSQGFGFAAFRRVLPGERSPVRVLLKPYPEGYERYDLRIDARQPHPEYLRRAKVEVLATSATPWELGGGTNKKARVRVRNADTEPLKFIEVTVALLDDQGKVRTMGSSFVKPTPLPPGAEGEAELHLLVSQAVEPFRLEAWADADVFLNE